MANGRRALSRSASLGTLGKSLLCQSGVIWITELARNTITAETRIGNHSDSRLIMETPLCSYVLWAVPRANFNQTRPASPNAARLMPPPRRSPSLKRGREPPIGGAPTPSEGAFRLGLR